MSRAASIPSHLHVAILNRWLSGSSASEIAEWIEQTNPRRSTPVLTSRASIQRCIKATAESDSAGSRLACVQRARARAPELMDALEDVDRGFLDALAELKAPAKPDCKTINSTGALLSRRNVAIHRELRLAGLTGPSADALVEKHQTFLRRAQDDVRVQNERSRARFAPEGDEEPNEPESIGPEMQPISDSIRADAQSVAANEEVELAQQFEEVDESNEPESIHPETQPIVDSIRADTQPVVANEQVDLARHFEAVLRQQESLSALGLPADLAAVQLPPELLSRFAKHGIPNGPESESLVSQLIEDSIRAGNRAPRAA